MTDSTQSTHPARAAGRTFIRYWLPVAALCALIFMQSAYPPPGQIPPWPHIDKLLHLCVYGLLGALICRALSTIGPLNANKWRLLVCAVVLTTLYGLSDEWHQSFVPGRDASAADLLADFAGALVGSAAGLKLLLHFRPLR
ncbi:MAG: VanZ family protein [Desulfobacteraceae bacterium]|jgi:VanZ family protein